MTIDCIFFIQNLCPFVPPKAQIKNHSLALDHGNNQSTEDACNKLIFFSKGSQIDIKKKKEREREREFSHGKLPRGEHALLCVKACDICTSYGI